MTMAALHEVVQAVAKERDCPPAQVALAWLLSKPVVSSRIIGASKIPHLEQAVAALELRLSEDEIQRLEAPYVPHRVIGHS